MLYGKIIKKTLRPRNIKRIITNAYYAYKSAPYAGYPFKIQFENTNVCNIRCIMCPQATGFKRKQGFLKFDKFKKVFDEVQPAYLNLTGIGEPFLNADIYDIVSHASKQSAYVKLDTNATLFNESNLQKMFESEPSIMSVSLDGTTKEVYEKIRVGANFEKVIDNIRQAVKIKKEMNAETEIHLFMVVQKDNYSQLLDFIKLGNELGVDAVNGTFVVELGTNSNEETSLLRIQAKKMVADVKKYLVENKIKIDISNLLNYLNSPSKHSYNIDSPCFWPWYAPFITWDGYLSPCCFFSDKEVVFGNVFEDSFIKVFNSPAAKAFRKQLVTKRVGKCATCGVNEKYLADKFRPIAKIPIIGNLTHRKY